MALLTRAKGMIAPDVSGILIKLGDNSAKAPQTGPTFQVSAHAPFSVLCVFSTVESKLID